MFDPQIGFHIAAIVVGVTVGSAFVVFVAGAIWSWKQ